MPTQNINNHNHYFRTVCLPLLEKLQSRISKIWITFAIASLSLMSSIAATAFFIGSELATIKTTQNMLINTLNETKTIIQNAKK